MECKGRGYMNHLEFIYARSDTLLFKLYIDTLHVHIDDYISLFYIFFFLCMEHVEYFPISPYIVPLHPSTKALTT
jgi:hypothetical protein